MLLAISFWQEPILTKRKNVGRKIGTQFTKFHCVNISNQLPFCYWNTSKTSKINAKMYKCTWIYSRWESILFCCVTKIVYFWSISWHKPASLFTNFASPYLLPLLIKIITISSNIYFFFFVFALSEICSVSGF